MYLIKDRSGVGRVLKREAKSRVSVTEAFMSSFELLKSEDSNIKEVEERRGLAQQI